MATGSGPTAQDVTQALQDLSVEETKDLVFRVGVPLNDVKDIDTSGGLAKAHFVQKWLDMYPDASWENLVTALRSMKKNTLAAKIEQDHVPIISVAGNSVYYTNYGPFERNRPQSVAHTFIMVGAKITMVGPSGVGKTSLLSQYMYGCTPPDHMPSNLDGSSFSVKAVPVFDRQVSIQLYDTVGQERYEAFARKYFENAKGIVLVYDMTDENTFRGAKKWLNRIKELAPEAVQVLLVGNKTDLKEQRAVSKEEGEELAKKAGSLDFFETSAKTGENVTEVFEYMAAQFVNNNSLPATPRVDNHVTHSVEKSDCCCHRCTIC